MFENLLHKIRRRIFSPESKLELLARSLFHRMAATKLYFCIQNRFAKNSYRSYLNYQHKQHSTPSTAFAYQPKVTFLVDASTGSEEDLTNTLSSLQRLTGGSWEALVYPPPTRSSFSQRDEFLSDHRIQYVENHTRLMDIISGEYLVFCQSGDCFFDYLLLCFYAHLEKHPANTWIYFDSEVFWKQPPRREPFFKPGTFSPALLFSLNYLSRGLIRVSSLAEMHIEILADEDLMSQEYQIAFKLYENGFDFQHLPIVLVSQARWEKPDMGKNAEIILNHLSQKVLSNVDAKVRQSGIQFTWAHGIPSIAIIILTRNHPAMLKSLLQSIRRFQYDYKIEFDIVDNDSDDPATLDYYEKIAAEEPIKIIPYWKSFNYSEAINTGVANSHSDLILLLNDDMQAINDDWLSELAQWASLPDTGVVGAKLIRANRIVQHAGIIMGLTGFVGHIYLNAPEHYFGLWGSVDWYRNISAVTGACQMMRREVFQEAGGYDEGFQLAFGDIDFCCRVSQLGYQNIYTPFAKLFHYEGRSRGYVTPVSDILRGYDRFAPYLLNEDPNFSPNLTYTRIPKCHTRGYSQEARRDLIQERKAFYLRKSADAAHPE